MEWERSVFSFFKFFNFLGFNSLRRANEKGKRPLRSRSVRKAKSWEEQLAKSTISVSFCVLSFQTENDIHSPTLLMSLTMGFFGPIFGPNIAR